MSLCEQSETLAAYVAMTAKSADVVAVVVVLVAVAGLGERRGGGLLLLRMRSAMEKRMRKPKKKKKQCMRGCISGSLLVCRRSKRLTCFRALCFSVCLLLALIVETTRR